MKKIEAISQTFCEIKNQRSRTRHAYRRNICHGGRIHRHIRNYVLRNEARPGTKTPTNQGQMQQMQQMQIQMQIQPKKLIEPEAPAAVRRARGFSWKFIFIINAW